MPKYVEDARRAVLQLAGKDDVIDAVLEWIQSSTIHGYHGSRLRPEEVLSIKDIGLTPLSAPTVTSQTSLQSFWKYGAFDWHILNSSLLR
jgi:hypothetical protein